jgi:hypothetical protein
MGLLARHDFDQNEVEALLAQCHRRCCVCHRFCGVKIEVDHITGADADESGDISNAIALCFECHAEVHHYNPSHPKGRKFRPRAPLTQSTRLPKLPWSLYSQSADRCACSCAPCYFVGTSRFSSSNQFISRLICVAA